MHITKKTLWKIILDVCMLSLLVLMYQKRVISMHFHEVGGLVLFGLFLLHNGLNWKWIKGVSAKIFRRGLPPRTRVSWLVNVLLFIAMAATVITGLLMAKTLPTAMQGAYFMKPWHYFSAAAALILAGIHLGLHWKYLHQVLLSRLPLPQRAGKVLGTAFLVVVLAFGAYSLGHFSAWLSGPFQANAVFSESHQQPPAEHPGESEHTGGKHEGPGKGRGQGLGKGEGKGAQGEVPQQPNVQNILSTMATYASITVVFACLTVLLEKAIIFLRRPKAPQQD